MLELNCCRTEHSIHQIGVRPKETRRRRPRRRGKASRRVDLRIWDGEATKTIWPFEKASVETDQNPMSKKGNDGQTILSKKGKKGQSRECRFVEWHKSNSDIWIYLRQDNIDPCCIKLPSKEEKTDPGQGACSSVRCHPL